MQKLCKFEALYRPEIKCVCHLIKTCTCIIKISYKGASIKDVHTPGGRGVFAKSVRKVYKGGGGVFELCTYTFLKTRADQIFFVRWVISKSVLIFWNRNVPKYDKKSVQILRKK